MRRGFILEAALTDISILAKESPMTDSLRELVLKADYKALLQGSIYHALRSTLKQSVIASTDPWSDVEYQSLYVTDLDNKDRIVLQEPPVKDPMVGVMVLKAARLRGESGMVYCGPPDLLKSFNAKLPEYEKRGEELAEKDFLICLSEAAEHEGLRVVHLKIAVDHGGDDDDE